MKLKISCIRFLFVFLSLSGCNSGVSEPSVGSNTDPVLVEYPFDVTFAIKHSVFTG